MSKHYFYGQPVVREEEEEKVRQLLKEFKGEKADEALKEKIWQKLQKAKTEGFLSIPFKVALRKGVVPHTIDYIEVILDTKV